MTLELEHQTQLHGLVELDRLKTDSIALSLVLRPRLWRAHAHPE